MSDKSNPYRFTLLFNEHDQRHRRAVEILNQQGKSKSQYIVTAILHYIDCNKLPVETGSQFESIERVADRIIQETADRVIKHLADHPQSIKARIPTPETRREASSDEAPDAQRELLSAGMGAFRTRK